MGFKTNINSQERGFWFAPNGDDAFDGSTLEKPKETIQAAIDAGAALIPPPSFNFSAFVTAAQGGEFFDPFTMISSLSLNGMDCNLIVDADVAVTMASNGLFTFTAIRNDKASGICVKVDDVVLRGMDLLFMGVFGANGIGMTISGTVSGIFNSTRLITITGEGGIGYDITSTQSDIIDLGCDSVNLFANNAVFIKYNPQLSTDACEVDVSTVISDGFSTTAFIVDKGVLVVRAGIVNAPTFAIVSNDALLTIRTQTVTGALTLNDTATVTIKPVAFYDGDIDVNDSATLFGDFQLLFGNIDQAALTNSVVQIGFMVGDIDLFGTMFLEIESMQGNLTVQPGATLHCDIASLIGTITNNGVINGIINGIPFGTYRQRPVFETLLTARDATTQSPAGTDILMQVKFGAAQLGASDPVQLDALGNLKFNEAGQFEIGLILQYGRTGAGSFALLFFRVLVDGVQIGGQSQSAKLDNTNANFPIAFGITYDFTVGQILTVEIWRDSTGFDAGSLFPETPALAGPDPTPSAAIVVKRGLLVQALGV